MKNNYKKKILATIISMMFAASATAANQIIQNEYVRAGVNETTGTLGSGGSTSPGLLFDSTGTGTFNTSYDYLTPGTPFEGFGIKVNNSSNTQLYQLVNNNTGTVGLSGGAWVGTPTASQVVWEASNTNLVVRHTYSLAAGVPYIDITTRIDAVTAMPHLYFSRFIDPDARAAAGDSSQTDNVIGYGAIPASNVVFSEALSSRYALGLYSAGTNSRTAVTRWTTDPTSYYTNTVPTGYTGATYGRGDDTIGIAFYVSGLNAGDYATFRYAYIFGPSAFAAASSAVTNGAGGGTANVVPGGGTLTDVGSATSAASSSSAPTVTGTSTTNTVSNVDVTGTPVITTSAGTASVTTAGMESQSVQTTTVTTYTPITRTTTTTPVTVTTYSDSSTTSSTGNAVVTTSDVSTTSVTATTTTITETVRTDLPVITASLVQHQASETAKVQTIARETTTSVTTPINQNTRVTVVTNGTTTSDTAANVLINNVDTTVANESFSGRIDQMAKLAIQNRLLDRSLNMDAFRKDGVTDGNLTMYVNGGATETNVHDSYATSHSIYGLAADKKIDEQHRMGVQYNRLNTKLTGPDSATNQSKYNLGIFSVYTTDKQYTVVNNLGYSTNNIKSNRSVQGEFTNSHSTKGTNVWLNNRVYLPADNNGIRPFVGATLGTATTKAYTENGSIQSARTVNKVVDNYNYAEAGLRYDGKVKDIQIGAEIGTASDGVTSGKVTLGYAPTKNGVISVTLGSQNYSGVNLNSAAIQGIIRF